ncbi:TPA: hypothetical protein ACRZQ7_004545, partial [Escherichia coli]
TNEKVFSLSLLEIFGVTPFRENNKEITNNPTITINKRERKSLSLSTSTRHITLSKFAIIATITAEAKLSNIVDLVLAEFK